MLCGIDEAGRGPCIGPLVIAGVIGNEEELIKLKVKDSKKLTPKRRKILAEEIKKICEYEVLIISAEEIDKKRKMMTMNELEVNCYAEIIEKLCNRKNISVYVDAVDVDEQRFAEDIKRKLNFEIEIVSKHKADDIFPIVSSASIIAKVLRDEEIKKIEKQFGEIGSGYPSDERTINFLRNYLKEQEELPKFVRKSWETVRRLLEEKGQKKLE